MKKVFPGDAPGTDIFPQKSPVEGKEKRDASRLSRKSKQLNLWEPLQSPVPEAELFRQKPQIVSISGISPKEPHRYRVVLGAEVLGDRLNLDEALKLAQGGEG
jgi:hypothetical protein